MRARIALLVAVAALGTTAAAAGTSRGIPNARLVPNAVAFGNRQHGVLGTGWLSCVNGAWHCRPSGAIEVTSDGGRTWEVVRDTPRPVVRVAYKGRGGYYVQLDDGETLIGHDATWRPTEPVWGQVFSVCPKGWAMGLQAATFSDTGSLALCTGQPAAGSQAKAIYRLTNRGWKRVAYAPLTGGGGYGGISSGGYPQGIAGARDGFGIVWESRGTLFVTRDGGHHWHAMVSLTHAGDDFGDWAYVLGRGVGFALLSVDDTERRRLIETTDAGRTWHVVHRWACTAKRQRCGDVAGPP